MQTSVPLLIPSPFRGRARACPVLDTGVGVKSKVEPNNCAYNNHLTPIPTFPLAWGKSFNDSALLIPSPFRGRAREGVKSKVEPNNCAYNNHLTLIPAFPLAWGRSFNNSALLIPSPFRDRARVTHFDTDEFGVLIPSPIRGRARVGVEMRLKSNNSCHDNHLTPIPSFPLTWGRSFNHAE